MVYPILYHSIYKFIISIVLIYNTAERLSIEVKLQVEKTRFYTPFIKQILQMCNEIWL